MVNANLLLSVSSIFTILVQNVKPSEKPLPTIQTQPQMSEKSIVFKTLSLGVKFMLTLIRCVSIDHIFFADCPGINNECELS